MRKFTLILALAGSLLLGAFSSFAQTSTNQVKYQITFDQATQTYTVWVIPQYSTPNANNPTTEELGSTAQVTLKIPKDFVMKNLTSIRGSWRKPLTILGNPATSPEYANYTYDKNFYYCSVGKEPGETNYGQFTANKPVALFSFQTEGCTGPVSILEKGDPFVHAAFEAYSLNVECSFYSRSGQLSGGNGQPTEQFIQMLGPAAQCQEAPRKIDLVLTASLDNKLPAVGDQVKITVVVKNNGPNAATGVAVKDAIPLGLEVTGSTSTRGTYSNGTWVIGALAVGESVELTLTTKVVATGVQYYVAEVSRADQEDINSTPDNDVPEEDDYGQTCAGAPILLCAGQAIELSIASTYTSVQWFRNGTPVSGANSTILKVTTPGTYTFTAANAGCATGACCPIIVEEGNCCPAEICVPVTIKRVRTAAKK